MERPSEERGTAFVLLDGIGDVNIPDLGSMTPLNAAWTPTLDAIAGTSCYILPHFSLREIRGLLVSLKGNHLVQARD